MRNLIQQIIQRYKAAKLEGQDWGYLLFRAQEPDTKQPVWIKVLPHLLSQDSEVARRFQALTQAIRQLNHPNIPPIRAVGDQAGLPYVITRAIEKAQPLAAKLDQDWTLDAAIDIIMQAGQALEHAYHKGLIHGFLTPDKILMEDNGKVQVTDLGLGELLNLLGLRVKQTMSPYLAPEWEAGHPSSPAADVYSLAAILYHLLTKRAPLVVKGQVLPPSRFNPEVPPAINKLLIKALDPDPANRYPNVQAFLGELGAMILAPAVKEAALAASAPRCPKCGAENQTGRFCRRCGVRLQPPSQVQPTPATKPKLEEPIQVTTIQVGHIEIGVGVERHETVIAQPMPVATGELQSLFPEPLPMPQVEAELWPGPDDQLQPSMPKPPPMPVIEWAELVPPIPQAPRIEDVFNKSEDR
ncbi:MAG: serine/threonine protein kinase [Anaerolineae bacterium]